jgi:predicted amidohydrolase YtcJ
MPGPSNGSLILSGGPIWTGTGDHVEWIRVEDGSIVAVGTGTPPPGDRFDLDGRALLPGFHDAHVHPPIGGMAMIRCELHGVDPADYRDVVAAYAADHPDRPWIIGGGWSMAAFPGGNAPARILDEVVPDRPVLLHSGDGHAAWVNTRALEAAGITFATPDPSTGRIARTPDGLPIGTLHEGAVDLALAVAPEDTVDDLVEGILAAQEYLLSFGITAWQDAWVRPVDHAAYRRIDDAGALRAMVSGSLWWDRDRGTEQLAPLLAMTTEGTSRYRPLGIKLMVDGVIENGTGAMCHPYVGTDDRGLTFLDRETLLDLVPRVMAAGIQPHFHAIGDCAIRSALDAVAAAEPADVVRTRPHIAHIHVVDPIDVHRFAELGVAANAQMLWACNDDTMVDLTVPRLGARRAGWQYPFRALVDAGAHLAAGSDWSVSTPDPFAQMAVAETRLRDEITEPLLPHQSLTREASLVAFTAGSAWVCHDDRRAGTIEVGKAADFAVASDHPLTTDDLGAVTTTTTIIGGEVVSGA